MTFFLFLICFVIGIINLITYLAVLNEIFNTMILLIKRHTKCGKAFITTFFIVTVFILSSCNPLIEEGVNKKDLGKDIELVTDYGSIIMRLSDETPKHRNNFIRMVNMNFLDSMSFYRVINTFLIQTGKDVPENIPGLIDAEIRPELYHRRGSVNAARADDDLNPGQASANFHFTIIQGKVYSDSLLEVSEQRINNWRAYNKVINDPVNEKLYDRLKEMYGRRADRDSIDMIRGEILALAGEEMERMEKYRIPGEHRQVYKTVGGAAHLDQNYTVFGEVVKGMDIVDKIASVETDRRDSPLDDVMIITARLIKRKNYDE